MTYTTENNQNFANIFFVFLFLLTEFKGNLAMISASHVDAWSRQLDGPVPEHRTKLIYQIINFNEMVYVLLFVVCLHLVI